MRKKKYLFFPNAYKDLQLDIPVVLYGRHYLAIFEVAIYKETRGAFQKHLWALKSKSS